MTSITTESSTLGICECGVIYQNVSREDLLQKIINKSAGDKLPCDKCINRLIDSERVDSPCCFVCKTEHPEKKYLFKHILFHHIPSMPYKCKYCGEAKFKFMSLLELHIGTCPWVPSKQALESSKDKSTLKSSKRKQNLKHSRKIISTDNTECEEVIKSSLSDEHYYEAYPRSATREPRGESFVCHLCGKYYNDYYRLIDHLQVHEGRKLKCKFCDKEYLSKNRVLSHMRNLHRNKIPKVQVKVECNICNQSVPKIHLKNHKIRKHGTPAEKEALKKYKCSYCGLRFINLVMLSDHVNSNHTGDKPHVCKTCGKAFGSFMVLKRHQVIHTREKKYKCDTCGLSFNQKCTLTRHQVVHTGEKPFECGICGQRFTQKPYMMAHKKKHKEGEVMEKKQKKKKKQESSEESEEDMSEESEEDISEESEEDISEEDEKVL